MKTTLAPFCALLALTSLTSANDILVPQGGSIQLAILSAADGDRVLVQPGTYHERIDFLGKAIQVIGLGGADQTTLDADLQGTAVLFLNGEGPASRLAGFTVTRGFTNGLSGGGITASLGTQPTIEDCTITGNSGKRGGGVHGSPIMLGCLIRQNTASGGNGGGLWGAPDLYDCVIADNTVTSGAGGGMFLAGGQAVISNCLIESNRAILGQGVPAPCFAVTPPQHLVVAIEE